MTLPRRAFLASLLAAPFVPKFAMPKAMPFARAGERITFSGLSVYVEDGFGWRLLKEGVDYHVSHPHGGITILSGAPSGQACFQYLFS